MCFIKFKYGKELQINVHLSLVFKKVQDKLLPIQMDRDVAPKELLEVIRCNCKMGCETLHCSCRKAGLDCSAGCGECRGICANMSEVDISGDY